jgi:hypothetical protein
MNLPTRYRTLGTITSAVSNCQLAGFRFGQGKTMG